MPTGLSLARAAGEAAAAQFVVEAVQTGGGWLGGGGALASGCIFTSKVCSGLAVGMDQGQLVAACTHITMWNTKAPRIPPFAVNVAVMLGAAGPAPSFYHSNQWKCALVLKSGAFRMKSVMVFLVFIFFYIFFLFCLWSIGCLELWKQCKKNINE